MLKAIAHTTTSKSRWPKVLCAVSIASSEFYIFDLNDTRRRRCCVFSPDFIRCSLIISVGKFYVRTSAIIAIETNGTRLKQMLALHQHSTVHIAQIFSHFHKCDLKHRSCEQKLTSHCIASHRTTSIHCSQTQTQTNFKFNLNVNCRHNDKVL